MIEQPQRSFGTFIPNAWKQLVRSFNNTQVKYGSGIMGQFDRLAAQIFPWHLPKQVDIYTGEVQTRYNIPVLNALFNSLSPVKVHDYAISDFEKRAIELGVSRSQLTAANIKRNQLT